jgi:hypothetical protein
MTRLLARPTSSGRANTIDGAALLLAYAVAGAAIAAIGLVTYKVWKTPHFPYFPAVMSWTAAALIVASVLNWAMRRPAAAWPASIGASAATSWIIAIQAGIVLLVIPVFLLVKSIPEEDMTGWLWPLVNKRWLVALYNIAIATFVLLPLAVERWRRQSNDTPPGGAHLAAPDLETAHWLATAGSCVAMISLCWYLAGPPWHLDRLQRVIEWHEQLHFGPLQALVKGALPSIGPAATPYGPGSEILLYRLMRIAGPFDVVSSRIAWAAQNFAALLMFSTAAALWLKPLPAAAVLVLAVAYSPFGFFYTLADGTLAGFFGWANPLRYIAPVLVVPMLGRAAISAPKRATVLLLGAIWGAGAFLAQESLTTTFTGAVLLLMLLWLQHAVTASRAFSLLRDLLIGFAFVAIPVLLFYVAHGAVGAFVRTYFYFARAVAVGYSNMWWPAQDSALPELASYHFTLPFLIACAVCALWRFSPLRPAMPLDRRRIRFLAFVCVQLVCYQTALLRSDSTHVMNTMIALPFIIVLGLIDLPGWLTASQPRQWAIRLTFAVAVMVVYPTLRPSTLWSVVREPARRFADRSQPRLEGVANSAALRRLPLPLDGPLFLDNAAVSVRQFDDLAREIHTLVGRSRTYWLRTDWISGGLVAFAADLVPAPHPLGGEILSVNDEIKREVAQDIRAHPEAYEAFIGPSLTDAEAQAFLESHPGAIRLERWIGASILHILLARP